MIACAKCINVGIFAVYIALSSVAFGQHAHPTEDVPIHEQFYATWFMPDDPTKMCCGKKDCYPTVIKMDGTTIMAQRREDGKFIPVPQHKVEQRRDNPDGRSHLCAPPPASGDIVYCFALGWGF